MFHAMSGLVEELLDGRPFTVKSICHSTDGKTALYKTFRINDDSVGFATIRVVDFAVRVWVLRPPPANKGYNEITAWYLDDGRLSCRFGEVDVRGTLLTLVPRIKDHFLI